MKTINVSLPYNFTPRLYQVDLLDYMYGGGLRAIAVWNRRDCKNGHEIAKKWIAQAPDEDHEKKMRRVRLESVQKMNGVRRFAPPILCRIEINKGWSE